MVRDTASKESIRCWSVAREKLPSNRKRTNQCVRFMTVGKEAAAKAESGSFAKALRRRRAEHGSYLPIMPSGASGSRGTGAPAPCPTFGTLYEPEQKSTS